MPSKSDIENVVKAYVDRVAQHDPEKVADLFAPNATVEDPVGTELKADRQAIVDFFAVIANMEETTTGLMWTAVAADTAVFQFKLRGASDGRGYQVTPIDIMTFDEDAKILTMRAVWDPVTDVELF